MTPDHETGIIPAFKKPSLVSPGTSTTTSDEHHTQNVFIDHETHDLKYKTLSWQFVSCLMIAEVVSNAILVLPNSMAVVGIVPGLVLTIFLGIFGLYTALLLVDFKCNHPEVHSMGDAGYILFGPIGREVFAFGSIVFAIFCTGSALLAGRQALSTLIDQRFCAVYLLLIYAIVTLAISLPRTLDRLRHLGLFSVVCITLSGIVAMIGAGLNPVEDRIVVATRTNNLYEAFLAVTSPVFSYAGHFMFFVLVSEMQNPKDAKKAAWVLQGFATTYYVVFTVVMYAYLGSTVNAFAFLSLPPAWAKASFGLALGNFLIGGGLYAHTAAKLVFVRCFRHTQHMYTHTFWGWLAWTMLCVFTVLVAFILVTAVPVFVDFTAISASLFASWYTYGIAGFFWLYDTFHRKGKWDALKRRRVGTSFAVSTVVGGAFMCIAGTYVSIKLVADAYSSGQVGKPFSC